MILGMKSILFITIWIFLCHSTAQAWDGFVTRIIDGDTIEVLDKNKKTAKVRLYGIDCPEMHQAFGKKAKRAMADLVFNQEVEVHPVGHDRYKRQIGVVILKNGTNVNLKMIELGFAWVYPRYCKEDFCKDWRMAEGISMDQGIGLWAAPQPMPPWEWRRNK